jgi:hypothetical protein
MTSSMFGGSVRQCGGVGAVEPEERASLVGDVGGLGICGRRGALMRHFGARYLLTPAEGAPKCSVRSEPHPGDLLDRRSPVDERLNSSGF